MTKEYADYLAHYGVKGQKHGKRRWQNEDGSLTEEGRIHYGIGDPRQPGRGEENQNNEEHKSKAKRILAIAAGVAVAGLAAYGVYRGTGKLKQEFINKAREGAKRNFRDAANFNTTARDYQNQAIESMRTDGLRADYYNKVGTINAWRRTADAAMSRGMAQRKAAQSATRASAFIHWFRNKGRIVI